MNERAILEALQSAVRDHAVPDSIMPTLPVKYVGRTLQVPTNQKYLELLWIPSNRNGDYWGGEKNHQGLFRMVLHWPNDNLGAYGPIDVIESIGSYFTKDCLAPDIVLLETPDFRGPLEMGHETLYPSQLRYQSYRSA